MSLVDQLIRHEGLRLKPYKCPAGKLTIGVGRNLEDVGITEAEARYLLNNDIIRCWGEIHKAFPWSLTLPQAAQDVLCNMCFNLGITKLKSFKHFLEALKAKDYKQAAVEMRNSKWATQVGKRADELADVIRGL